ARLQAGHLRGERRPVERDDTALQPLTRRTGSFEARHQLVQLVTLALGDLELVGKRCQAILKGPQLTTGEGPVMAAVDAELAQQGAQASIGVGDARVLPGRRLECSLQRAAEGL